MNAAATVITRPAACPNGMGSARVVYSLPYPRHNTTSDTLAKKGCLMSISKSIRFEVFKRDSFTCQYCGAQAPDVVLEIDHIHPVSEGGTDDLMNLVTACFDCNRGKSDKLLSDDAAIQKRKQMLDDLQERREQLEMLLEWQRTLMQFKDDEIQELHKFWCELNPGYSLNEGGLKELAKWKRRFTLVEVLEAIRVSVEQYLRYENVADDKEKPTQESVIKAFQYIPRIITIQRREKDNPVLRDLYYARGILRKRLSYVNEWKAMELLQSAIEAGYSADDLKELAKTVKNWTEFRSTIERMVDQEDADG